MKRRAIFAVMVVIVAGLVGCTPAEQETPTPEPVVSTPTPTPTPQWTEEEQAAIDAVQNYLAVWTSISQDPGNSHWDDIRDVAGDPAASDATDLWLQWYNNQLHLTGKPIFIPARVAEGGTDYQGTRYHVYGCYSTVDSYLVDANGTQLTKQAADRATVNYLVLHMLNPRDRHLVLEDTLEGDPC